MRTILPYRLSIVRECKALFLVVELSSQTLNPGTDVPHSKISYSPDIHHAPGFPYRSSPPAEPPLCDRFRSPPASHSALYILGYKFEEHRFIRRIPFTNPLHRFKIQRYAFPHDKPILLREDHSVLMSMSTKE